MLARLGGGRSGAAQRGEARIVLKGAVSERAADQSAISRRLGRAVTPGKRGLNPERWSDDR